MGRPDVPLHSEVEDSALKHTRRLSGVLLGAVLALWCVLVPAAEAQAAPHCEADHPPAFVFGFASLKAQLGGAMGDPVSCEYADPNGTGDTLQDTSTGLAFWRKSTNTPTFTSGTCGAPQNPWGFTFCGGSVITSPPANLCSVFHCIASFWNQTNGYVVQCRDGLLSHSGGVRGSCSSHGGNGQTLYAG
jgi:hypothetical protein